jgi:hypothetical protein
MMRTTVDIQLDDLINDLPRVHSLGGDDEAVAALRLASNELEYLWTQVRPGMKTLETGAGLSTVIFALRGAEHTCIAPGSDEIRRIREYCVERGISLDSVTFVEEYSEFALPSLQRTGFELALIDGRHGFPAPFIDWFYITERLADRGVIIIDDLHIWCCELLKRYVVAEGWRLLHEDMRAAIVEKPAGSNHRSEWVDQKFVTDRSMYFALNARLLHATRSARRGQWSLAWRSWKLFLRRWFSRLRHPFRAGRNVATRSRRS